MLRVSKVPFEKVDPDLQKTMRQSDEALGGSEWIQVFAHTPDLTSTSSIFTTPILWSMPTDQRQADRTDPA